MPGKRYLEEPINNIIQEVGSDSYKRRRKKGKKMIFVASGGLVTAAVSPSDNSDP